VLPYSVAEITIPRAKPVRVFRILVPRFPSDCAIRTALHGGEVSSDGRRGCTNKKDQNSEAPHMHVVGASILIGIHSCIVTNQILCRCTVGCGDAQNRPTSTLLSGILLKFSSRDSIPCPICRSSKNHRICKVADYPTEPRIRESGIGAKRYGNGFGSTESELSAAIRYKQQKMKNRSGRSMVSTTLLLLQASETTRRCRATATRASRR
jgi:hypothetical protein